MSVAVDARGSFAVVSEGYFETMRTYGGRPALLDRHLARLRSAVEASAMADAPASSQLAAEARTAAMAAGKEDVLIRIEVRDGEHEVQALPLPVHALAGGAGLSAVILAEVPGYSYPLKSTERAVHAELLARAEAAGADEAIITDSGEVIEATRTNVLVLKDGELATPPAGRCLPGVTRDALLEVAPELGLTVAERRIDVDELASADEVLLSNALIEVRRVSRIGDDAVGGGDPGMHVRLLAALLARYREG